MSQVQMYNWTDESRSEEVPLYLYNWTDESRSEDVLVQLNCSRI